MIELMTEWKEKFLQVELKTVLKNHFDFFDDGGASLKQSRPERLHLESVDTVKKRIPMKIVEDQARSADEISSIAYILQ
jgi:hypothetical protein